MICLLRCGHTMHYDPEPMPGDEVYCRRCTKWTDVAVSEQEWLWRCKVCHTTKKFGADRSTALGSARRHQRKYHHVVMLKHGYDTVEVIGPEGQQELSLGGERISWVRDHQSGLRAAVERVIVQRGQSKVDGQ